MLAEIGGWSAVELLRKCPRYPEEVERFCDFLESAFAGALTQESVQAYLAEVEHRGYAPRTYNLKLTAVKQAVRYVLRESGDAVKFSTRLKVEDFLGSLKAYKVQSVAVPEEDILTPHEIERLKENASPRLRLIVRFLYHTGARVSEMTSIRQSAIEEKPGHYRVHIVGKGKKARVLKVSKPLMADVQDFFHGGTYLFETRPYRNGRPGGKPLDRHNLAGEIRALGRRFLGKRVTPHSFRHAFATHLIGQGKGIKAVSNYVGHSSVSTTLDLYVHETLKPEDLPG